MIASCFRQLSRGMVRLNKFQLSFWSNSKKDTPAVQPNKYQRHEEKPIRSNKTKDKSQHLSRARQNEYSAYFQQKECQLDQQSNSIINDLNVRAPNNAQIILRLQNYLKDKQSSKFLDKTPEIPINLLTAIQMRDSFRQPDKDRLRRILIEHIIRHQTQNLIVDQKALLVLVKTLGKFRQFQSQKIKWTSVRYLAIHLLQTNFIQIPISFFPYIFTLLHSQLKTSSIDNFKYVKFINLLQEKLNGIFLNVLTEGLIDDDYKFLLHHEFMMELMEVYDTNGLDREEYGHTLHEFLIKKYFSKRYANPLLAIITNNVIYRFFPSNICNEKKQNLKLLILNHIVALFEGNNQLLTEIFNSRESQHFCYSILTHFFHSKWNELQQKQEDGISYIDQQCVITPPVLPQIFWKLYKANASFLNSFPIIHYAIKNCYPHQFIPISQKLQETFEPSIQTEMNIRVTECLKQLNINFKCQEFIAGRFIDFSLQDNILLEVDGVFHYQPRVLAFKPSTNFRNLHLILSGYKLMTINIYQYNICRQTDQLAQLISKKLQLLKTKAVMVI